jgi:hypothetical protein
MSTSGNQERGEASYIKAALKSAGRKQSICTVGRFPFKDGVFIFPEKYVSLILWKKESD